MFILLLALAPACCAPHHPAPKPAEPAPLPPPPPAPPERPVLHATWSFQTGPNACLALARAGAANLRITVHPEGPIRLTMSVPDDAPTKPVAHFSGPAGHWLLGGSHAVPREASFFLARDEVSLSRILMLLSGGVLNLEPSEDDVPILSLPASGAEGQEWFACARDSVN
jgi:hypothetical protein